MKYFKIILFVLFVVTSCDSNLDGGYEGSTSSDTENGGNGPDTSAGQVTAAEWNDLDSWMFWSDLLNGNEYFGKQEYWGFYTKNRLVFEIKNSNDIPVNGALISLYKDDILITEAKTDNFGRTNLFINLNIEHNEFYNLEEYTFTVNSIEIAQPLIAFNEGINTYVLDNADNVENIIEISFIVDATSSMSDELEFLKNDLQYVISNIEDTNTSTVFTSAVFYRDEGDAYVVKHSDFTSNMGTTIDYIEEQSADGGGDFPEAVEIGLKTSIEELQWSPNAKTKIAFLLLDAPPHYNSQIISEIHSIVKNAAKKGIKIIPVTASGIDKNTEFLMRFIAVSTNGTYVFITNDSGIGNDHLEASVGEYQVEFLNDLLIRLINKYSE